MDSISLARRETEQITVATDAGGYGQRLPAGVADGFELTEPWPKTGNAGDCAVGNHKFYDAEPLLIANSFGAREERESAGMNGASHADILRLQLGGSSGRGVD